MNQGHEILFYFESDGSQLLLDFGLQILNLGGTLYKVVATINDKQVGHSLDIVHYKALRIDSVSITYANPRKGGSLLTESILSAL